MSGAEGASWLAELEARSAEIADRLEHVDSPEARAAVKADIIALFRDVDAIHERVVDLREGVRRLVDAYKRIGRGNDRPVSVYQDSLNSSTFVERGWNFIAAEKYDDAVEALERALALSPGSQEAEGLLGWALMKSDRLDRALEHTQRVLLADPDNDLARTNLGYICMRRGVHGEAREHLRRVVDVGRDRKAMLYALLYLGELHEERGETEPAVESLKAAIELGPNLIEAYYRLGLLLARTGRADQARVVWESAMSRSAYNPYAKKARAMLEELDSGRSLPV